MRAVDKAKIIELQQNTRNIRNICILAHVDHGKTSLADSLVASNGIISSKNVGKLRYLDSRKDEQERGITMKTSSIALHYHNVDVGEEYLVNLIDSPGHVDFSSEVSTAVRLCDGAIIVVDVVEGVCPQTRIALKQAYLENIKPILVLNKLDRFILEMQLTPLDAYVHLTQVLEQINAEMGLLLASDVLNKEDEKSNLRGTNQTENGGYDWSSGLEDVDDSSLYFTPESGNVIFASALDGWGFVVKDFARLLAQKLGFSEELLKKVLWGDFYINTKTKRVCKGAQEKAKKPLFVQMILENIWNMYDAIITRKDKEKTASIVAKLQVKVTARDLRHTDHRVQLQAIISQWLPLAHTVLTSVCDKLPSPLALSDEKIEKLMCSHRRFDTFPAATQNLKRAFKACSSAQDAPIIVYISKIFPVDKKSLPQNKPQPLTHEELTKRREMARERHKEFVTRPVVRSDDDDNLSRRKAKRVDRKNQNRESTRVGLDVVESTSAENVGLEAIQPDVTEPPNGGELLNELPVNRLQLNDDDDDDCDDKFIAFARVFSGKLKVGTEVFVLGPKHDPSKSIELNTNEIDHTLTVQDLQSDQHITKITITQLYLLMGRELESLDECPSGNIIGIGNLENHVLKTATLSSTIVCPSFAELQLMAVPIVRVAVEPKNLHEMPQLRRGVQLLNQADACVEVLMQETGELVLITAGEVHLEKCLDDLKERYARVDIKVSKPIVPFRETIVTPPTLDMVNEAIVTDVSHRSSESIEMWTSNKQCCIKIRAVPLPCAITTIIEKNGELLKLLMRKQVDTHTERTVLATEKFKCDLMRAIRDANLGDDYDWNNLPDQAWSLGPKNYGPNVLINRTDFKHKSIWTHLDVIASKKPDATHDFRTQYENSLVNGFQMATLAGPLCEEPMMGVAFLVEEWTIDECGDDTETFGPVSGQIVSMMKEACRRAFQARPQRLMAAMYSCNILANAEILGKMYAVLGRRHGRILSGDMSQGSSTFTITAVLPVVESFKFAPEIRKQTSGLASPQLIFSHWEVIDIDPFWTPSTEEEYLLYGEKADSANRARSYMDSVRVRKGLAVESKLVEFAEKQRTLSKKK